MERQRENKDGKEEKQYERGIAEEPKQNTRGDRTEERAHKIPKRPHRKRARERTNRSLSLRPKFRQVREEQVITGRRKTPATREPKAPQPCERSPERAERGPSG